MSPLVIPTLLAVIGSMFGFLMAVAFFVGFLWDGPPGDQVLAYTLYHTPMWTGSVVSLLLVLYGVSYRPSPGIQKIFAYTFLALGLSVGLAAEWFLYRANIHKHDTDKTKTPLRGHLLALVPCVCWMISGNLLLRRGEDDSQQEDGSGENHNAAMEEPLMMGESAPESTVVKRIAEPKGGREDRITTCRG